MSGLDKPVVLYVDDEAGNLRRSMRRSAEI